MNWARRRKMMYRLGVLFFFLVIAVFLYFRYFDAPPTCFDNRKNGSETGVDCGGSCALYCPYTLSDPEVLWARAFAMSQTESHAVAMIMHKNIIAVSKNVDYVFTFYSKDNEILGQKEGSTFLGPLGRTAIIETFIKIPAGDIARTTFEIKQPISWHRIDPKYSQIVLKTERHYLENYFYSTTSQTFSRLSAVLENPYNYNFKNLEAVAILYDNSGNAITTSRYVLDKLDIGESKNIVFTWPYPYVNTTEKIEIYVRANLFEIEL